MSELQSNEGTGAVGMLFGKGMKDRLNIAYTWVKTKVQKHSEDCTEDSEKLIDIYGFSRGAAAARTFVNLINQALKTEPHTRNVAVRFLGIFDTVASTGAPGLHVGLNLGLDSGDFKADRHCTARDEVRANFPLSVLNINQHEYAGVHSDIGGGYGKGGKKDEDKSNWLAGVPCWDVYVDSKTQGVEYRQGPQAARRVAGPSDKTSVIKQMTPADVEPLRAESNAFDTTDKTTPEGAAWKARFIHKSDSWYDGANTVKDYNNINMFTGQPLDTGVVKRERIDEQKYKLGSKPANFSWK